MGWGHRELGPELCMFFCLTLTSQLPRRYESHFIDEETDSGIVRNLPEVLPGLKEPEWEPTSACIQSPVLFPVLHKKAPADLCSCEKAWMRKVICWVHKFSASAQALPCLPPFSLLLQLPAAAVIWCKLNGFIHPSMHSLNKDLPTASFVSVTVLGAGEMVKSKPHKNPCPRGT